LTSGGWSPVRGSATNSRLQGPSQIYMEAISATEANTNM
jgi:hypothetical protein